MFVIDELPYLAEADNGVLSVIQNHIDGEWASGQMFLILCGSSISFMENEVLGEKSSVFGRRTAQIKLEAFSYMEAAEFVPDAVGAIELGKGDVYYQNIVKTGQTDQSTGYVSHSLTKYLLR